MAIHNTLAFLLTLATLGLAIPHYGGKYDNYAHGGYNHGDQSIDCQAAVIVTMTVTKYATGKFTAPTLGGGQGAVEWTYTDADTAPVETAAGDTAIVTGDDVPPATMADDGSVLTMATDDMAASGVTNAATGAGYGTIPTLATITTTTTTMMTSM